MPSGDNSLITEEDEENDALRQEFNNILVVVRHEFADTTKAALIVWKDLGLRIVDEAQKRCMMEALAEDESCERTKIATYRMVHERTATRAALSSPD